MALLKFTDEDHLYVGGVNVHYKELLRAVSPFSYVAYTLFVFFYGKVTNIGVKIL